MVRCLELYTACILSGYHWDKAFNFPGKFHFLVKTITDSVRLGVVYWNLVLSTASGVNFLWNLSAVCGPHHHDPRFLFIYLFIYFIFNFFLTKPRSSIPNSRSPTLHPPISILDLWSSILNPRSSFSSKPPTRSGKARYGISILWTWGGASRRSITSDA